MIAIEGYDKEEMDAIEKSLVEGYFAQNEIEDIDDYVKKNAPPIFIKYCEKYKAARERLKKEGKLA